MFNTPQEVSAFETYRDKFDPKVLPQTIRAWYDALSDPERTEWLQQRFMCLKDGLTLSAALGYEFQELPHKFLFDLFVKCQPGIIAAPLPRYDYESDEEYIHRIAEPKFIALFDLDTEFKRRLILWPRGHFKTSAVVVDIVQKILNYPNVRIAFISGVDSLAKAQLQRVKDSFAKPTERFLKLFPEFCLIDIIKDSQIITGPPKWGTATQFSVPCRTNRIRAEATFRISTAKSVKAGSHFDLLYIDDLVNEQNWMNPDQLEKCYQHYMSMVPLLEPWGYIVVTGTRYSFDDTYGRLIEQAEKDNAEVHRTIWKISVRDCWNYKCATCGHDEVEHDRTVAVLTPPCTHRDCVCETFVSCEQKDVLFREMRNRDGEPCGFTLRTLEDKKREIGPANFANQYENNPIAAADKTFTEDLIASHTIFDLKRMPDRLSANLCFVVGDFAESEDKERDQSVMFCVYKKQGQLFVFLARFGRWAAAETIDQIFRLIKDPRVRPDMLYFEKTNGWEHFNTNLEARRVQERLPKLPITWVKTGNQKGQKTRRIGGCQEPLKSNRLFLFAGMGSDPNTGEDAYATLKTQLLRWPRAGKHDDFADCLGRVCEAPTGYQAEEPPTPPTMLSWLQRLHQSQPMDDNYPDTGMGNGIIG